MRNLIFFSLLLTTFIPLGAQHFPGVNKMNPGDKDFENIKVEKLASHDHASSFMIWIKESVRLHKHAEHDEHVYVISGKAMMTLGDEEFEVKKGDLVFIPRGTPHAVTVRGKTLQVISVQSPEFTGKDRIFLEN